MRVTCIGGGPAGLYLAILARRRGHEVTVLERDPAGATYGWGVVFWDDLLDALYRNDPESGREIRSAAVLWQGQQVRLRGAATAHLGGYGYSIGRGRLMEILTRRARGLGVDVRHEHELTDPGADGDRDLAPRLGADLVVACDGAGSAVREARSEHFGTRTTTGHNLYAWLGTPKVLDAFTFAFERTDAGWIWFHGYPCAADASTCVVECSPRTWHGLGLDTLGPAAGMALLGDVFAAPLAGQPLLEGPVRAGRARWLRFRHLANRTWRHGDVVLAGDAAHTTHFSIGSGTKLAILDAIALADVLPAQPGGLQPALRAYDAQRRAALAPLQESARRSMSWFEDADAHLDAEADAVRFGYALWKRRGHYPPWRYPLHLATQVPALRRVRREVGSARRALRARRRGEPDGARSG